MNRIEQVRSLISDLEPDMEKFYEKGNKAAGTRARKTLQDIKKVAQEIRLEIQEWKNTGKSTNCNFSEQNLILKNYYLFYKAAL